MRRLLTKAIPLLFLSIAIGSCKTKGRQSLSSGYIEDDTTDSARKYSDGALSIFPEYQNTVNGVLVAAEIITEQGKSDFVEMLSELLGEAGKVYILHWSSLPSTEEKITTWIQQTENPHRYVLIKQEKLADTVGRWARDWAPISAYNKKGETVFLDFNYHANRPTNDSAPALLARHFEYERVSVPLYLEGGNLLTNGKDCLTTNVVKKFNNQSRMNANRMRREAEGLDPVDDESLSEDQIVSYLKTLGGCDRVKFLYPLFQEGTGHIDMFAKFIGDNQILLADFLPEVIVADPNDFKNPSFGEFWDQKLDKEKFSNWRESQNLVRSSKMYLDANAIELEKMGYKVTRIPMPIPFYYKDANGERAPLYRSYTNSLFINGQVIIPSYSQFKDDDYIDSALISTYEDQVKSVYTSANFQTYFENFDKIILEGGSIHCTTMDLHKVR